MKSNEKSFATFIAAIIAAVLLSFAATSTGIEVDQGGAEAPAIGSVDISVKNVSGFLNIAFTGKGTAPPGTENLNVTFGVANGTRLQTLENLWFQEGGGFIFGNGILLEAEGNDSDPWSSWTFKVRFALPYTGDPMAMIGSISSFLPFEIDNSTLEDIDLDPENLTRMLMEMELYFVARAFDASGSWGQKAYEITAHVQTAALQFMIDEGMVDDPGSDDDDTEPDDDEEEEDEKEASGILLLSMAAGGALLLLGAAVIAVFLIARSRKG